MDKLSILIYRGFYVLSVKKYSFPRSSISWNNPDLQIILRQLFVASDC